MDYLDDPNLIADLSRADLAALLSKTKSLEGAILGRLLNGDAPASDRNLDADELARALGMSRRNLFRTAKKFPFIKRVSRKSLVGSEAGLPRWLKAHPA